jgi:hypothetical protein
LRESETKIRARSTPTSSDLHLDTTADLRLTKPCSTSWDTIMRTSSQVVFGGQTSAAGVARSRHATIQEHKQTGFLQPFEKEYFGKTAAVFPF